MDITAAENGHQNYKPYKVAFLAILSLTLQLLMWWFVSSSLYDGKPLEIWVVPVLLASLWITVFSFFITANNNKAWFYGVVILGLLGYFLLFPKAPFVWSGGLLFGLLSLAFQIRLKALEKNQSHFSIRRLLTGSVLILTNALILTLGFNIYHNTNEDFKKNPEAFYDNVGRSVAANLPQASKSLPDKFDLNQSLDQFLTRQVEEHAEDYKSTPEAQREEFIGRMRDEFLRKYNLRGEGDDSLAQILTVSVMERFKESARNYEQLFPLIFTVIILALLRTFAFLFNWLTALIAWMVFKVLLWIKFFRIAKVQVEVDKLEI